MTAAKFLVDNPDIRHGTIKLLFTPDEEIGRGVDKVDLQKLGADFGYTMDGETAGHIEDETFSADGVKITIQGVAIHPGFAKGKMENAIKIAGAVIARLPKDVAPETTSGRQGFVHPIGVTGAMDQAVLSLIVRDFEDEGLAVKEAMLEALVKDVMADYPGSTYAFEVTEQYRNMKKPSSIGIRPSSKMRLRPSAAPGCNPCAAAFAAARTDRGFPSWACPAPTSSPAAMPSTRRWNG